jgi:3-oxoacyl-[acyl-carrier protein] reductase
MGSYQAGMQPGDELAGKVALVTGAARNIGRAIARSLAAGGAAVAINTRSSRSQADSVAAEIAATGGQADVFLGDVGDGAAVNAVVDAAVKRFGRLDILVLNAAVRQEIHFSEMTYEDWKRVLAIDLDSAFHFSKACLPHLINAGAGSIVTIGGVTALAGSKNRAHVGAAKSGLVGFTKSLAHDLAQYGIRVNCVSPGQVATKRGPGAPVRPDKTSLIPLARAGEPEEIAGMVRFLCGPGGSYITGQTLHVNGGLVMP